MKSSSQRLRYAVAAVLAGSIATPGIASAQPRGSVTALEEIVVTARKTEETLQDVPAAVSAFNAESIADRQIESIDDVARFTPGFIFSKAFGRTTERPVIRGQGNVLAGVQFGVESGAAYFVDGIYYPGSIQSLDLSDLERVEVIRGPQSALYGRNTYSGAVNFVTRSPPSEFSGKAEASFDQDETNLGLRFGGPIAGEVLTGSVSLKYNKFDGQWKNEVTGKTIGDEETKAISGVLEWRPNEEMRVKVRGTYNEDRDGTRAFWFQDPSFNNCYPGTRSLASFPTLGSTNDNQYFCGTLKARKIYANDGPLVGAVQPTPAIPEGPNVFFYQNFGIGLPPPFRVSYPTAYDPRAGIAFSGVDRDRTLFTALWDWDIMGSGYNLVVDTGIRRDNVWEGSDSDFTSVNLYYAPIYSSPGAESVSANTTAGKARDYSLEFRLESPRDREIRWMLGGFYYEQDQKNYEINFDNPRGGPTPTSIADLYNKAVFGLVEWKFGEGWSITGEGRYAEETKALYDGTFTGKDSWKKFTPRVTLAWAVNPDLNLYAIYAEGLKPGGFNGAGGAAVGQPTYQEETSKNYELGLKSVLADGAVSLNLAVYLIDAKDVQLTTPLQLPGASTITSLATNQGEGEIKGLELEARWRATDYLTLGLTYALADTQFTKGFDDFQWTLTSGGGVFSPLDPTNPARNPNGNGDGSIKGKQYPLSAKNQASATADWLSPLNMGNGWNLYANLSMTYEDKKPVQVHNEAWVPSATILDARIGVSGENWNLGLYGRNLTGEDAPQIATRWFQWPVANFGPPLVTPLAPTIPGGGVVSTNFPRGFFGSVRRDTQVGIEASYKF